MRSSCREEVVTGWDTDMSNIQIGDLVVVVRRGCADTYLGTIFRVAEIRAPGDFRCRKCGQRHGTGPIALNADDNLWTSVSRLRRIPTLSELESTHEKERVGA